MTQYHAEVVRTEASAWFAQIESGDLDTADVEALREWLARSPLHVKELKRLARLSSDLNILTSLARPIEQAAETWRPIVRGPHRPRWSLAVAAVTLMVTAVIVLRLIPETPLSQTLITGVGEYKAFDMPDGSIIALNTGSRVEVSFSRSQRKVSMLSGEALFTVAKDRARPFIVSIGHRKVEAVGTAFVVRLNQNEVEVAVTEGQVRLSTTEPENPNPVSSFESFAGPALHQNVLLDKGQSLKMPIALNGDTIEIQSMSDSQMRRKLAWREGLLDFERAPLRQVIQEVNRHSSKNIVIQDTALMAMEFDGLFRVGETDKLLQALALRTDIDVQYLEGDTVLLSQRKPEPK